MGKGVLTITSPVTATVTAVHVIKGDEVTIDQELITLEAFTVAVPKSEEVIEDIVALEENEVEIGSIESGMVTEEDTEAIDGDIPNTKASTKNTEGEKTSEEDSGGCGS